VSSLMSTACWGSVSTLTSITRLPLYLSGERGWGGSGEGLFRCCWCRPAGSLECPPPTQ
jgi:hypothetical protein